MTLDFFVSRRVLSLRFNNFADYKVYIAGGPVSEFTGKRDDHYLITLETLQENQHLSIDDKTELFDPDGRTLNSHGLRVYLYRPEHKAASAFTVTDIVHPGRPTIELRGYALPAAEYWIFDAVRHAYGGYKSDHARILTKIPFGRGEDIFSNELLRLPPPENDPLGNTPPYYRHDETLYYKRAAAAFGLKPR